MSAKQIVMDAYKAFGGGDIEAALKDCADHVEFRWACDDSNWPMSGRCVGKSAFVGRLNALREAFDYNSVRPATVIAEGDRVAAQVELDLTHRATARRVKLENAHFWRIDNNRVVELVEYFDTALVKDLSGS